VALYGQLTEQGSNFSGDTNRMYASTAESSFQILPFGIEMPFPSAQHQARRQTMRGTIALLCFGTEPS
jgi:hypothetical protein